MTCLRQFQRWRSIPTKVESAGMKLFGLVAFALLTGSVGSGQEMWTGIRLGGGSSKECPVIVTGVWPESPAQRAGIKLGDVLLAVDGRSVATLDESVKILHSKAEIRVVLRLMREATVYDVAVDREQLAKALEKAGFKELSMGMIAPLDATETEMQDKIKTISEDRFAGRVFPTHYPANEKLYYGGFEVLILKNPSQVAALGIEDGPASRAGVHWGDTILAVNGVDPRDKSVTELEQLFSREKPAPMSLRVERGGSIKTYQFELKEAAQVLRDNGKQIYHGSILLPISIPEKYLPCFLP
jgi:C-terminal processing protease CtpA/Prc